MIEDVELFGGRCFPGVKGKCKWRRYGNGGKESAFAYGVVELVAMGGEANGANEGNDIGGDGIVLWVAENRHLQGRRGGRGLKG